MAYFEEVKITGNTGATIDAAPGAAVPTNAVQVGGSDGTDLRAIATDTTGRIVNVGAAASGSAVAGNPVLVGGSDGTDARSIATDTGGQVKVLVENSPTVVLGAGSATVGTVTAEIVGHAGATLDGTAGAPSTGVFTVQGVSGGTAQPVTIAGSQSVNVAQALGSTMSKTNGVFVVPGDNTNSITMKAASTQSATTDTSLVVQINPEQPNLTTALNVQDASDGSVSAGTAAGKSSLAGGVVATSVGSGTAGQQAALQLDGALIQRVNTAGQTGSFTQLQTVGATGTGTVNVTIPNGGKVRVLAVIVQIVTNGTASNRTNFTVNFVSASSVQLCIVGTNAVVTANTTAYLTFAPGVQATTTFIGSGVTTPAPPMSLGPGCIISASCNTGFETGGSGDKITVTATVEQYYD